MSLSLSQPEQSSEGSQLRLSEALAKDHQAAIARLFELVTDLVLVTSQEGEILIVNPAWEHTLGWTQQELIGRSMFELVAPEDEERTRGLAATTEITNYTNRYRHKDGTWRWLLWSGRTDGDKWYAVAKDVTERLELERRALYDDLTGLANRALLLDHLRGAIKRLERSSSSVLGVLFVDLDGFKMVNDGRGHEVGDELLRESARRLRETVRESDVIGRFGGDEFVIVAENFASEQEADALAERVLFSLQEEFDLLGQRVSAGCSVGVAATWDPEADPDAVIREADIAMYRAKTRGGGRVERFDARARTEVAERVQIERELRRALQDEEFVVHYQPVVTIADGTVIGCEALVRWRHPERGMVAPEQFVPLAEANGLIVELGGYVLAEACRQAGRWHREGRALTVSVNVSRRQLLEPGFVDTLRAALTDAQAPATSICLEITETAAPARHPRIVEVLREVRRLGVNIALDDFGSGYSTLTNLREIPLDAIKIDESFVAGVSTTSDDRGLVAAVMALARELGLSVVAEGVEEIHQLEALRKLGCQYVQGFLFAHAAPADELAAAGFIHQPRPVSATPS